MAVRMRSRRPTAPAGRRVEVLAGLLELRLVVNGPDLGDEVRGVLLVLRHQVVVLEAVQFLNRLVLALRPAPRHRPVRVDVHDG